MAIIFDCKVTYVPYITIWMSITIFKIPSQICKMIYSTPLYITSFRLNLIQFFQAAKLDLEIQYYKYNFTGSKVEFFIPKNIEKHILYTFVCQTVNILNIFGSRYGHFGFCSLKMFP